MCVFSMQGFELFGREMQLGWGQEKMKKDIQPEDTVKVQEVFLVWPRI